MKSCNSVCSESLLRRLSQSFPVQFGFNGNMIEEATAAGFPNHVEAEAVRNLAQPMVVADNITIEPSTPLLSSITMIAPSPDWFTGLDSFDMRNPATNTWYGKVSLETYPYDSGTDSGTTYNARNLPTFPQVNVFRITQDTAPATGELLGPNGSEVLPVGKWECTLVV